MPTKIEHTAIVPYNSEQMFALVNNIQDYQQFVPYCCQSEVHMQSDRVVEATLTLLLKIPVPVIGVKKVQQEFRTRNHLTGKTRMDIELVNGPMRHLTGFWLFEAIDGEQSKVCLSLDVEFESRALAFAFKTVATQVAASLVEAFIERAKVIYEKETLTP